MRNKNILKHLYLWLALLFLSLTGVAQQRLFTGTITDKAGQPVPNVLVTVSEAPGVKVFTDNTGKFSVNAENGWNLEVRSQDGSYRRIKLDQDQINLVLDGKDELVQVGHRTQLRRDEVTSSIGYVNSGQLGKNSVLNPANALYGLIPGLTLLQNGGTSWENEPDLYIRGVETFGIGSHDNTGLLVLVDGFERPLSSLSLAEVESVTVLKDAAATAPYGIRGANGVLLVTTKKGSGKGLTMEANYEHGISSAFRLPKFLDSYNYANAINQAYMNDGGDALYTQSELNMFKTGSSPYLYPNTNWLNEVLRDQGTSDLLNISFQEQANAVRYFVLVNYYNEKGLLGPVDRNEGYSTQLSMNKFNFRTNIDIDLNSNLKLAVNLAGNIGTTNRPGGGTANDVFSALYTIPSAAFPVKTYNKEWGGNSTFNNNPVALVSDMGYMSDNQRELMTDFILEQKLDKLIKGLKFEAGLSFDKSFNLRDGKTKQFRYEQISPILDPGTGSIIDTVETVYGTNTTLSFSSSIPYQWRRMTYFTDLRYEKEWNDNKIGSMIMFQSEEMMRSGRDNTFRRLLGTGNVHYSKADKYFVDLVLSYSGSNLLPAGNRFGLFPAISAAWKISEESFLSGSSTIDNLKLRASYGISGSDLVIQNISISPFVSSSGYLWGNNNSGTGGYAEGRLASSPLTFESSYKSNLGIDLSLLKMIDLNVDVFYNTRKNILVETSGSISDVLGVDQPYSSAGIVSNKGFEAGINFHNFRSNPGGLKYNAGIQLSRAVNKIIDMKEVYRPEEYLKRTGLPIGQAFGLEAIGFFDNVDNIENKQTFSIVRPGDVIYKDQNEDHIINAFDEVAIGHSTKVPEMYFAGTLNLEFKGVGVEALLQGIANQTIYLNTPSLFWPLRGNTSITTFSDGAWTPETAASATLPRLTMSENSNNYRPNTIWYADGSYIKLRSLQLYYDLPGKLLSRLKMKNTRIYLRGMNLYSWDNIKDVDPESIGSSYPTTTTYNAGINLTF